MFNRLIIKKLELWTQKRNRKPLILRGARQVGKTTAINIFSTQFDQYIYLNLELSSDRELFEKKYSIKELILAIFFLKEKQRGSGKTLIFIDEIQNSSEAVSMLRYFYEDAKDLYVVAAGSLLESLIDSHISFPVGRVEYLYMKPLTFKEYLTAVGDHGAVKILDQVPCPDFAHDKLIKSFHTYTLIGGMPEIVETYSETQDLQSLKTVYENLLQSYMDDVEKYARNKTLAHVLRHAVKSSFYYAASRIRFEGFGNSNYRSREMGEALRTLEKAMLIDLMYPSTGTSLPIIPDCKKSPRLYILDTGIVNFFAGIQKEFFGTNNLNNVYAGRIAEHIVGQELFARFNSMDERVLFWVREKKQSHAEVDFVIPFEKYVIPVEVKSGKNGRLRSLHAFIDNAPHNYAVRIYSGELKIDKVKTLNNKEFYLLNLPFYLTSEIKRYLIWFMEQVR